MVFLVFLLRINNYDIFFDKLDKSQSSKTHDDNDYYYTKTLTFWKLPADTHSSSSTSS